MDGIRAELVVENPARCDVTVASRDCGPVVSVSRSAVPDADGYVHDEFTVREGPQPEEVGDATPIVRDDRQTIYRLRRKRGCGCVCECIEQEGCTVRNVRAVDGTLFVTVLAEDLDGIRAIVATLRETNEHVRVSKLVRTVPETDGKPRWWGELDALTERQREVLKTAYEMGYFAYPREATAAAVAERLDIATPTFTEHLAAAERKLLDGLLERSTDSHDHAARSER